MFIFEIIVVIFAAYCSISYFIKLLKAFKAGGEEQIRTGNFNTRQGRLKGPKPLIFMLVSSPIAGMSIIYLRNLENSMYLFFSMTLCVLVFEVIILSSWEIIQDVIKCYKKNGLIKTILIGIYVTIALAAVLYVKYKK